MAPLEKAMARLGQVFEPIMPAFIVAGVCMGAANLMAQCTDIGQSALLSFVHTFLCLVNDSFTPFLSCWIGFYSAKMFGGSAILGAMLGLITTLPGIDSLASILSLEGVLHAGAGGVLAAFFGALILARLEVFLSKRIPSSLSLVFTPLLALVTVLVPYILVIMPLAGIISTLVCSALEVLDAVDSLFLSLVQGFVAASIFLPLTAAGLHHGVMALYPIQLEKYGYISLYPVFAMAGAGQVGAGLYIWRRAKKEGNEKLSQSALASALPGALGVAGPLTYGITLPHPRAFLASCLGAGVGGSVMKACSLVSTGWGPSGLLAIIMMDGPHGAVNAMGIYLAGLAISMLSGYLFCALLLKKGELEPQGTGIL